MARFRYIFAGVHQLPVKRDNHYQYGLGCAQKKDSLGKKNSWQVCISAPISSIFKCKCRPWQSWHPWLAPIQINAHLCLIDLRIETKMAGSSTATLQVSAHLSLHLLYLHIKAKMLAYLGHRRWLAPNPDIAVSTWFVSKSKQRQKHSGGVSMAGSQAG